MYFRMHFQREFPVQRVTYFVKPLPRDISAGYGMYLNPYNCRTSPLKEENDGYTSTYVENVPASRDEPFSPTLRRVSARHHSSKASRAPAA